MNVVRSVLFSLVAVIFVSGCTEPIHVHSADELQQNLGKKISFDGIYDVDINGEYVRMDHGPNIMLDELPDILGFGKSPTSNGSTVHAHGILGRGAMVNGMFMEEGLIPYRSGSPENPVVPGFVLHDAKLDIIALPGEKPTTQPAK